MMRCGGDPGLASAPLKTCHGAPGSTVSRACRRTGRMYRKGVDPPDRLRGVTGDFQGDAIVDELAWRGLIAQTTDEAALRADLAAGPLTLYYGFDPTAESLHAGNLLQLT